MFGELSLTFGVVLTSSFFSFSTEKNKGSSFVQKPRCLLFGAAHGGVWQDSLAGPFLHRALLPSPTPALFLLPFPAQILGPCRDVLSVLLWNEGLAVL